jgi:hypothetical protein
MDFKLGHHRKSQPGSMTGGRKVAPANRTANYDK